MEDPAQGRTVCAGRCGELVSFEDLGEIPYAQAYQLQCEAHAQVLASRGAPGEAIRAGQGAGRVFLLEHVPSVITVSRRAGARAHVLASPSTLEAMGVEVVETDRGGDVTWHGKGQIVAYLILDLNRLGLRVGSYLRLLEGAVIDALAQIGIEGRRDPTATGVWVGDGKICAMGVRLSRWVSMHGIALNVNPDLRQFDLIVPCGLAGRSVTSVANALGSAAPPSPLVKRLLVESLRTRLEDAGQAAMLAGNSGGNPS